MMDNMVSMSGMRFGERTVLQKQTGGRRRFPRIVGVIWDWMRRWGLEEESGLLLDGGLPL